MTDTETYPIPARFTAAERKQLTELAAQEHRAVANLIYVMVMEGIARRQPAASMTPAEARDVMKNRDKHDELTLRWALDVIETTARQGAEL